MDVITEICIYTEIILIAFQFWKSIKSDDVSKIWSPINIISLVYIYYCIIPHFYTGVEAFAINEKIYNGYLFHIASLLSYLFILMGFSCSSKKHIGFTKWNSLLNEDNARKYGLILCAIGFICYSIVHGFNFSLVSTGIVQTSSSGYAYYLDSLIELFPVGLSLLICTWKKDKKQIWVFVVIWLCFVTLVLRGSRGRMIMALLPMLVVWHSYPIVQKVRYVVMVGLMVIFYLFFAVMDSARTYYGGINMDVASSINLEDASKGAGENYTVYQFTMMSIDRANNTGERCYFDPLITAICMPIPRAIFPWKPDARYLSNWETALLGETSGNAMLNIAESYMSFGWFGIVFWAWVLGWLARRFWDNYIYNRSSIGAILLLGTFNGMCYIIISRGYLAQSFSSFLYSICLPFWIITLLEKCKTKTYKS